MRAAASPAFIRPRAQTREDECLRRFRDEADAAAMEEFVRRTRKRLLGVARRIGAPQDAEDSVQAAYHALLRRPERPDDVVGWLVATVVRIAYRRKAAAHRESALAERLARPRDEADAARAAVRGEEDALVRSAVHRLPARYRDAVVLHHIEGLPLADVARLLDVAEATAKTRVQRGRALLRMRLESRLAFGALLAPWHLLDTARASPFVGGIMQAKMTIAAIALVAAAVTVGVAVRESSTSDERTDTADATPPVARRAESRAPVASRPRKRKEDGAPRTEEAGAAAIPVPTQPGDGAAPRPLGDEATTARIAEAAKSLDVSDDALRAAIAAYTMLRDKPDTGATTAEEARVRRAESLAPLAAHGEQGFLALIALLRGGIEGTYFKELVPVTGWRGRLSLLIDVAENRDGPKWADWTALQALGTTDAPEARDYLVARLRRERDPGLTMCAAESLGCLKEPRGVLAAREFLRSPGAMSGKNWNEVTAGGVLFGVMGMDKETGGQLLDECARDAGYSYPALAIEALGEGGRAALARAAAEALAATERVRQLSVNDAAIVEKWAKKASPR